MTEIWRRTSGCVTQGGGEWLRIYLGRRSGSE